MDDRPKCAASQQQLLRPQAKPCRGFLVEIFAGEISDFMAILDNQAATLLRIAGNCIGPDSRDNVGWEHRIHRARDAPGKPRKGRAAVMLTVSRKSTSAR